MYLVVLKIYGHKDHPPLRFSCHCLTSHDMIKVLVENDCEALKFVDTDGNLPLHLFNGFFISCFVYSMTSIGRYKCKNLATCFVQ